MGAAHHRGQSEQSVQTPKEFIQAVQYRWGQFSIDLAADAANAQAPLWIDEQRDSLKQDWSKEIPPNTVAWLNPPYSDIRPWVAKCFDLIQTGHPVSILVLVPASVGSNWYRDYAHQGPCQVRFLNNRIKFVGHTHHYPKDMMLLEYARYWYGTTVKPVVWNWVDQTTY